MADSIEVKGKSVDEAVYNGLIQLGLGIDEVDIEILEEGGRRFLGIGKSACVRLTKRETPSYIMPTIEPHAPVEAAEEPEDKAEQKTDFAAQGVRESVDRRPRLQKKHKSRQEGQSEHRRQPERAPRKRENQRERHGQQHSSGQAPMVPMLDNLEGFPKAAQAIDFLTGLFNVMGLEAAVGALETTDEKNIRLKITGEDTSILIGRRGETLDALQYLTGLIVNRHTDEYIRVMLDAENYRQKRQQTLEKLARRLANNVAATGRDAKLEPMNPYERRILHAALQDNDQVETHSEGVDPKRYVVIRKKKSGPKDRNTD